MASCADRPDPERLLAESDWIRRLAGGLAHDRLAAEDLGQSAWVAALGSRSTVASLREWLGGIVRNTARMQARAASRRKHREHVFDSTRATEDAPSPEDLLLRLELQRALADLVASLDEPLRTTILLRYLEGLDSSEIARRQAIASGTVRWRLKKALEELRRGMEQRFGEHRSWQWLLLPSLVDASGPAGAPWLGMKGALMMKAATKTAIVVIALLLAAIGGMALRREARRPRSGPTTSSETTRASVDRRPPPPQTIRLPTAKIEDANAHWSAGGFGGRVISSETGQPVAHASLTFLLDGAAVTTESDDLGRFVVRGDKAGTYELASAMANGFLAFEPQFGHSPVLVSTRPDVYVDDVTIFLTPALRLMVAVQDTGGKPISAAEVRAIGSRGLATAGPTLTNPRGEAELAVGPPLTIEARKAGYLRSFSWVDQTPSRRRVVLTLEVGQEQPLLGITGRVVDKSGAPVDGALVEAYCIVSRQLPSSAAALSNVDGRFSLTDLAAGAYRVRATTRAQGSAELHDIAAGARDVELRLGSASAGIRGTVRDAQGEPVAAFTVVAWPKEGVFGRGTPLRASVVDPRGRYLLSLPAGSYSVAAAGRGYAPSSETSVEVADTPVDVDFSLQRGSRMFGKVVERGTALPIAGARVGITSIVLADGVTVVSEVATDADGRFDFDGLRPGRTSIDVEASSHNGRIIGGLEVPPDRPLGPITVDLAKVAPGQEKIEFVGIAAALSATPQGMVVTNITPGGGAADARLQVGDIIVSVDGQLVAPLGFNGAIQLIRGPEGTVVLLSVKHTDGSTTTIPVLRKRLELD